MERDAILARHPPMLCHMAYPNEGPGEKGSPSDRQVGPRRRQALGSVATWESSTACWSSGARGGVWFAQIPEIPGCFLHADSLEMARENIRGALRAIWRRDEEAPVLRFERVRRGGLDNEPLFVETPADAAEAEVARQAEPEERASRPLPTIRAGEPLARHPSYALSYGLSYEGPVKRRQVLVQLDDLLLHQMDGWSSRLAISRSELIRRAIARELERLTALEV